MNFEKSFEKELEEGNLYQLFLTLNLSKIKELAINSQIEKERDFYNKLYELTLQTKQMELVEKGVF